MVWQFNNWCSQNTLLIDLVITACDTTLDLPVQSCTWGNAFPPTPSLSSAASRASLHFCLAGLHGWYPAKSSFSSRIPLCIRQTKGKIIRVHALTPGVFNTLYLFGFSLFFYFIRFIGFFCLYHVLFSLISTWLLNRILNLL